MVVPALAYHEQRSMGIPKYTLRMKNSVLFNIPALIAAHHLPSWGNVNSIGIRSCYDEGKRVAESLTYSYHRQNNVEVRVARIFNTFGRSTQVCTFER